MNKQTNWWEPIFTGKLKIGVNREKLDSLTEESISYYEEASQSTDSAF